MKIIIRLIVVALVVVVFLVRYSFRGGVRPTGTTTGQKTLEEKIEILAQCGLNLAAPFTVGDLLTSWDRSEYEKPGYELVLVGFGMTEEEEPWRNHCVNLWHFDTECIESHGDYKRIAERMAEMAQGSLPLENIQDHVDIEKGQAWLSFRIEGKEIRIDCKVEDDWVDTGIFARFVEMLKQSDSSKIYIYYDLGGQDCIIGCVTKDDFECLRNRGINFVPLT